MLKSHACMLLTLAALALGWVLGNLYGYRCGLRNGISQGKGDAYMEMINKVKKC